MLLWTVEDSLVWIARVGNGKEVIRVTGNGKGERERERRTATGNGNGERPQGTGTENGYKEQRRIDNFENRMIHRMESTAPKKKGLHKNENKRKKI